MVKLKDSVNTLVYDTVLLIRHYFSSLILSQVLTTFFSNCPVDYQSQTKLKTFVLSQCLAGACCLWFKIEKEAFVPESFPFFFFSKLCHLIKRNCPSLQALSAS